MNNMTLQYLETALWSSTDEDGEPLDAVYGVDDIAPETVAQAEADCAAFEEANQEDLDRSSLSDSTIGHNFWLNRNGHGAGFWDLGNDPVFDRLSDASKVYGSVDLYIGDDGLIHGQ